MSWTGSENERREQGICRPPAIAPDKTARFTIQACTLVGIAKVDELRPLWRIHLIKADLGFERYEILEDCHYIFRHLGYFIRVGKVQVKHREAR